MDQLEKLSEAAVTSSFSGRAKKTPRDHATFPFNAGSADQHSGGSSSSGSEMMGALYEDMEKFFGDIFAWYGRVVARYPVPFVVVPLVVCALLALGCFDLKYETNLETLYTPIDSMAAKVSQ